MNASQLQTLIAGAVNQAINQQKEEFSAQLNALKN